MTDCTTQIGIPAVPSMAAGTGKLADTEVPHMLTMTARVNNSGRPVGSCGTAMNTGLVTSVTIDSRPPHRFAIRCRSTHAAVGLYVGVAVNIFAAAIGSARRFDHRCQGAVIFAVYRHRRSVESYVDLRIDMICPDGNRSVAGSCLAMAGCATVGEKLDMHAMRTTAYRLCALFSGIMTA